jgi:hypothetical protein
MAATMSTRQLAAAQSVASIKAVPVAPIARAQSTRSCAVVDRLAIASPASTFEVSEAAILLQLRCRVTALNENCIELAMRCIQ